MTSKQAMLALFATAMTLPTMLGCDYRGAAGRDQRPSAPYAQRQVWAVAPLRNESGSRFADGVSVADDLTQQLTLVRGIDTLPVNRVLAAMQSLQLSAVTTKDEALRLRQALGADALLAGTLTAWDPYDPPKIGVAVELYLDPAHPTGSFDTRRLTWAGTEDGTIPGRGYQSPDQPVSAVSGFYDAADPVTRDALEDYGKRRGIHEGKFEHNARMYRISMDLYSEFVSHQVCSRLLGSERVRLTPTEPAEQDKQTEQLTEASP